MAFFCISAKRVMLFLSITWFVALAISPQLAAAESGKFALLIGIDQYKEQRITRLYGAVNDVRLMREVLVKKFMFPERNIKVLTNQEATHERIVAEIQTHLGQAKKDDVVVLHFSGHGSQMKDDPEDKDEIDGWDETLVAYDSRADSRSFDISDDEINGLLAELSLKTKNITVILDSCHSGSATKVANTVRGISRDTRKPPSTPKYARSVRGAEGLTDFRTDGAKYVLISGSLDQELSHEGLFEGKQHGALTWFFSRALLSAAPGTTYRGVMDQVKSEVTARYTSQHPQIEGPNQDQIMFGTDVIRVRPYVTVSPSGSKAVDVKGGKVFGLRAGSVLGVFPPNTTNFEATKSSAKIKLNLVDDFTARGEIVGEGVVAPHSRALVEAAYSADPVVTVYLSGSSNDLTAIGRDLAKMPAIQAVKEEKDARIVISEEAGAFSIRGGDLELLLPPVPINEKGAVQRISNQVKDLAHWFMVMNLVNPLSPLKIDLQLRRSGDAPETVRPATVTAGTVLDVSIRNLDTVPLYFYVLDVASDGSVCLVYPANSDCTPNGSNEALKPGIADPLVVQVRMSVPEGRRASQDVIKVIATEEPVDPLVFPQNIIRSAPMTKAATNPLEQLIANGMRGKKNGNAVRVKSWTTKQVAIRVLKSGEALTAFALSFSKPVSPSAVRSKLETVKSMCSRDLKEEGRDCEHLQAIAKDETMLELPAGVAARGLNGYTSVGQAFEDAYNIQEQSGALRVEPMFELQVPGIETDQGIDKRSVFGDAQHDPLAAQDDLWAVKQISAHEAWRKIRQKAGVNEGEEARGVLVAHIDTGYTEHPENWIGINGEAPIAVDKGRNYYEPGKSPLDPLLDDGLLDNPGHGTASGSVIISQSGCQLQGAVRCVNGIGRGARLIPLRVHRSVSQLNMSYMTHAIQDVADGMIAGNPSLVSIAMGGPPTFSLWRAVKSAEKKGVLIVAAAGNYVRTVVWPARFEATIAVAANNVTCQHWSNSSRGSAVDISAPGESVWRATLNDKHQPINGMGKGTTFATGHTSGAAALWLGWHSQSEVFREIQKAGLVTKAFRHALRQSAWRPSANPDANPPGSHCGGGIWNSDFGPGILNASALLDIPIEVPSAERSLVETEEQLPLFASLYPEGTDPNVINADYRMLFGVPVGTDIQQLTKYETEILHQYTMNDEVRNAIDKIVEGARGGDIGQSIRNVLVRQDISKRLRAELTKSR